MKLTTTALLILTISINSFSQNTPTYPKPKTGYKKVDLVLPKIENQKDFKIEIQFSFEANVIECSNASFYFNPNKNIKEEYAIPLSSRYPYFEIINDNVEILQTKDSNCKSVKKVNRKIVSTIDFFVEYQGYYARPFYIPESWSVEYKIWKASDQYITIK